MEDHIYSWPQTTAAGTQECKPPPKSNETRIVEALESIASEMFHIRQHLESVTDGGFGASAAAIRTTGR